MIAQGGGGASVEQKNHPGSSHQVMNRFGDEGGIYVEGMGVNVYKDGDGTLVEDDVGRGDEGEGGGDDQVAFAHAGGDDAQMKPCRAARDADGVVGSNVGGEALLELVNAGAEAEIPGLEHLIHCLDLGGGDVG